MKIIAENREEAVEIGYALKMAAGSVRVDMRKDDADKDVIIKRLFAMLDSIEVAHAVQ
jgi:hypothetical protein